MSTDAKSRRVLPLELALDLYKEGKVSPGRAAQLAGLGRWEFSDIAKARGIATPYTREMIQEDLAHGHSHL